MSEGRYIYCIAECSEKLSLGKIGIDDNDVYTIPCQDISAVVHDCSRKSHKSKGDDIVKMWTMTHECVVESAMERWCGVLPLSFDTIVKAEDGRSLEGVVMDWLEEEYHKLKENIDRVKGKLEYSVKVFSDTKIITERIVKSDEDLPEETAHTYKLKLKDTLRQRIQEETARYYHEFYKDIRSAVNDVKVAKLKGEDEQGQMLMNLSCLCGEGIADKLGEQLEKISSIRGFSVRFIGPKPPYSFVGAQIEVK